MLPYVGLSFGASCPARVYFLFNSKKKVPKKVPVKKIALPHMANTSRRFLTRYASFSYCLFV
jgi:hypothetical protein